MIMTILMMGRLQIGVHEYGVIWHFEKFGWLFLEHVLADTFWLGA